MEKIIKISHKDKPEILAGKAPPVSLTTILEMLNTPRIDPETFEMCKPKLTGRTKTGCIIVYGTGGNIDDNYEEFFKQPY